MSDSGLHILLVDDHALFLEGVGLLLPRLQTGVQSRQAGSARAVKEALKLGPLPDLVLLDWHVPELDSAALVQQLSGDKWLVPVIVVSASEELADVAAALDAGALGFVSKMDASQTLLNAMRQVLDGQLYLPAGLARRLAAWRRARARPPLSKRQTEVLVLVAQGMGNREIAGRLGIGEGTVKTHVAALLNYFGANNRTTCVHAARAAGLI